MELVVNNSRLTKKETYC